MRKPGTKVIKISAQQCAARSSWLSCLVMPVKQALKFKKGVSKMEEVLYKSTRGEGSFVTASEAILKGIAPDGGLYVPTHIPHLDINFDECKDMTYQELAFIVLKKFLSDYTDEELKDCIGKAYGSNFETEEIAPVVDMEDAHFLELYHGPTIAFKDMALQILPHLLTTAAKKNGNTKDIVILTATSGDTGKAALAGFADVPGTKIIVFYPDGGVSNIQRLQMVTQKGDNTCVIGVKGNFDDCQSNVKRMFTDPELEKLLDENNYQFSSANSINIGRLVPQIVYYVWSYLQLVKTGVIKNGDKINFVVPTGNFGNILAGYYASKLCVPVNKLICASNDNKVLYDFFDTGVYDRNRDFILTSSPSMDILISSNLERLIYEIADEDPEKTSGFMAQLRGEGRYEITPGMREKLSMFASGYSTEAEVDKTIYKIYQEHEYVIDTHTAVAAGVYGKYREQSGDDTKTVIVSTASPFKFPKAVFCALEPEYKYPLSDYDYIYQIDDKRGRTGLPKAIQDILALPIRHKTVCTQEEMEEQVKNFLDI